MTTPSAHKYQSRTNQDEFNLRLWLGDPALADTVSRIGLCLGASKKEQEVRYRQSDGKSILPRYAQRDHRTHLSQDGRLGWQCRRHVGNFFPPKRQTCRHVGAMLPTRHRPCRQHCTVSAPQMPCQCRVGMTIRRHVGTVSSTMGAVHHSLSRRPCLSSARSTDLGLLRARWRGGGGSGMARHGGGGGGTAGARQRQRWLRLYCDDEMQHNDATIKQSGRDKMRQEARYINKARRDARCDDSMTKRRTTRD
jgi:hypothetical protein